jgi:ribosomal protein L11 methyltransferase
MADRINIIEGDLIDKIDGKYDLITANLLTDPLKQLLVNIKNYMKPTSKLIIGGIVDFREREIIEMIKNDFNIIQREEENNWICLVLETKNNNKKEV